MPENKFQDDAEVIHAAYADRVADAFKIFAEALSAGQAEQACTVRFVRALEIVRRTRDLALRAALHGVPTTAAGEASAASAQAAEPLSAEDQALIDHALAGTTGVKPAPPPPNRFRTY